jgi:fibronectin type 3 domain-containing protein
MKKHFYVKFSLLVMLFFWFQLLLPAAKVFADTTNSSILPPSNLAYQLMTPDDVKLTWSSVYGATGYNVYGITDGQLKLLGTTTSTAYNFSNLPEGSYTYVVSTLSADGESGPCAPVTVNIVYPTMAAPATFTDTIKNGNDVVLNWSSSQYAQSYNLYQITADGQKTLVTNVTGNTYTITNSPQGTFVYAVTAVNSLYGESSLSTALQVEVVYPVMAAPANVTYKIQNGSDVVLSWTAASYATSYKVYELINSQEVLQTTVTSTNAALSNVQPGDHTYAIHSVSSRFGESQSGGQVTLTMSDVTMAAPANLTYSLTNGTNVTLKWSAVTYATAYNIYEIIDGQRVLKSTATSTTVSYSNLPDGSHLYQVYSYSDRFGESPDGSQIAVNIGDVVMAAPADASYSINNGNDIVLTWDGVTNAVSYKIYQVVNGQKTLKSTVTGTTATYLNMPAGDYSYEIHSYSSTYGESADGSQITFTLTYPTMQSPANVVQTVKNATDFTISWDSADYATSYKVYQIVNGSKVLKSNVAALSVTYTNMAPGDYTYEIHSYSTRFGESVQGTTLNMTLDGQIMQPPTGLTYSISNLNDITLKWTAAPYATSYKVYQVINGQDVLQKTVTTTSAAFTNMPGGDYYYKVTAVSSLLGESPSVAETTFSLVLPTLDPPSSLAYKIQNGNNVVLTWTAAANATSYKIYKLIDGQEVLKTTTSYLTASLLNVQPGDHTYVVHSVSTRLGESTTGSQISLTLVQTNMLAPTNLTYTIANGNDITLKWTAATYATSYNIYQVIDGQDVLKKTVTGTSATFANMPSGDYDYKITSVSSTFGESQDGAETTFSLVYPTMTAPANLAYKIQNGNYAVLTWTASPYADSYKVYEIVDGQEVLKTTVTGLTATIANIPSGDHTYVVYSSSARFGQSSEGSKVSFTLDQVIMAAPANLTQSIANGNDIVLRWNASTYATAYKIYQIVDGQKTLLKTVTTTYATFANMAEGDYSYEIHSYSDRFGESPDGSTVNFTLTWPVVQPPVLIDSIYNVNNITLSWKAVTWANEYRVYQLVDGNRQLIYKGTALTYKIYNLSEAVHSYIVTAYSTRFGESDASNVLTENIIYPIMQPPTASLKLLDSTSALISWNFITYANGYNIYEIIDGKPILLVENLNNLSYTVTGLTYADHQFYVTSYSNSFGESDPSNTVIAKLIVDTEPPVTTADAPADWTNQSPVMVNLTASDKDTGVADTYYSLNDGDFTEGTTITVDTAGVNKISFYSVDKAGNKEAVQTVYAKIDKTAPVTTSNVPAEWSNGDVTVNLSATDSESGVAKTFYSIDGSEYVEGTTFTVKDEGIHKITYYSVDAAGNTETINTAEVKIDKTAPTVTMDLNNVYKLGDTIQLNYTANDNLSGVISEKITILQPNTSIEKVVANGDNILLDSAGVYKVTVNVTDAAGNTTTIVREFQVYIPATIQVTPTVIKPNDGVITVRVTLPTGYSTSGLNLNTATLNGASALNSNNGYYNQAKLGQFKFLRSDINWTSGNMTVEFRCSVNGQLVVGQSTVKVQ